MLPSFKRTTIWLGDENEDPTDEDLRDIHTEDNMLAIETVTREGDALEVFIQPTLFPRIRQIMDIIEARGQ